jgi:hypothetical protein
MFGKNSETLFLPNNKEKRKMKKTKKIVLIATTVLFIFSMTATTAIPSVNSALFQAQPSLFGPIFMVPDTVGLGKTL